MTTTSAVLPVSRPLRRHRALAVLGGVAAAVAAWAVLRELGGVDLAVTSPAGPVPVGLPAVVLTALVAGLAGWGLLAALERWTSSPRRTWRIVAVAALAVSLAGPVTQAASLPAAGGLVTLHVVVAAALLTGLSRRC
jgi:Family of unknown function (DUF6069)